MLLFNFCSQLCDYYDCGIASWAFTCNFLAAPKGVDIVQCLTVDKGCEAFRKGDCKFSGTTEQFNIESAEKCKVMSQFYVFRGTPTFINTLML